jgi:hypothetical protein
MPGTTARFLPATYVGPRPFARRYPGCGNFCATRPFKFVRWIEGSAYGRLWSRRGCAGVAAARSRLAVASDLAWLLLGLSLLLMAVGDAMGASRAGVDPLIHARRLVVAASGSNNDLGLIVLC